MGTRQKTQHNLALPAIGEWVAQATPTSAVRGGCLLWLLLGLNKSGEP